MSVFHGDNSAMVAICHSGRNPTMRHLSRHHGISLTMIHDEVLSGKICLGYISTHDMKADIFTKFYADRKRDVWASVRHLINVTHPSEVGDMWGRPGIGHICAAYRKENKVVPHLTAMLARLADESIHCSNCRCDYSLNENNFGEWQNAR